MDNHPSLIKIADYTYDLPTDKIASYPLINRDESKLLVYKNGQISETIFKNIHSVLVPKSILIFNDTRVVQARLHFKNNKGQAIEIFCLQPNQSNIDIAQAMLSQNTVKWKCLVGNLKKWQDEDLFLEHNTISLSVKLIEKLGDEVVVQFCWEPQTLTFAELLEALGNIPIPPYIKRSVDASDKSRYQTIYAKKNGSVAAPTAGLHFTPYVSEQLKSLDVQSLNVTLHVGAGTFKPVKSSLLNDHLMHAEWIEVTKITITDLIENSEKTKIAVGTTSLRTLESLYWMGVKAFYNPNIELADLEITQWQPYELINKEIPVKESLVALNVWLDKHNRQKLVCKTQILLAPPYKLKLVDGIITNFHQPQSTLLLLISCIVGDNWKEIYSYALKNNFRFLSYGDSSILLK